MLGQSHERGVADQTNTKIYMRKRRIEFNQRYGVKVMLGAPIPRHVRNEIVVDCSNNIYTSDLTTLSNDTQQLNRSPSTYLVRHVRVGHDDEFFFFVVSLICQFHY
eukprot:6822451-Pyramimonas_sp.AAC.3